MSSKDSKGEVLALEIENITFFKKQKKGKDSVVKKERCTNSYLMPSIFSYSKKGSEVTCEEQGGWNETESLRKEENIRNRCCGKCSRA